MARLPLCTGALTYWAGIGSGLNVQLPIASKPPLRIRSLQVASAGDEASPAGVPKASGDAADRDVRVSAE